ncbi:hypothetical protein [Thiocystis violascens]|uniref:Uncharacterized protein n=1 Tax=Thiocystis violascens (strain ATCC 17096 / DSM 198 / 6111) TaxID=765911 RepID=I3YFT7_THIV6|nr:hypothetical protein [Thiocystis violascens]AFL75855.1 hypothetical protein Thivi_4021 [Thiocystis violascens DSM 198]
MYISAAREDVATGTAKNRWGQNGVLRQIVANRSSMMTLVGNRAREHASRATALLRSEALSWLTIFNRCPYLLQWFAFEASGNSCFFAVIFVGTRLRATLRACGFAC